MTSAPRQRFRTIVREIPLGSFVAVAAGIVATASGPGSAGAATANSTVSAMVVSATNLSTAACPSNTPGITDFGVVMPGTSSVTSADCSITWGSSNDTAALYLHRGDIGTTAMQAYDLDELDLGYGTAGHGTQDLGAGNDVPMAVALQADGRSVTAGYTYDTSDWTTDIEVSRFNADGSADASFGTGGTTITPIATTNEQITSMHVQADGKIVVGGWQDTGAFIQFLLARYTTAGTLDATYGTGGIVTTNITSNEDEILAMALQADGKIVVAGYSDNEWKFAVARYDTNGALDASFGSGGIVQTLVGTWGDAFAVAIQADGKIVAGGAAGGADDDFALVRYNPDGSLDGGFGTGGIVKTALVPGNHEQGHALAILPNGKIVLGGFTYYPTQSALVRYNTDGSVDTTFGAAGNAYGPNCMAFEPLTLAVQAGSGDLLFHCSRDGVVRFLAGGTLDAAFGTGGMISTPAGADWYGMAIDSQGSMLLVGPDGNGMADVSRYGGGAVPDYATGVADWAAGSDGVFGACLRSLGGVGVTPTWTPNAACPMTDGAYWNGLSASTGAPGSKVAASTTSTTTTATTNLRFGFRASLDQAPGTYTATLVFEVIAPGV